MSDINFEFENISIDIEATCRLLSCYIKASGYTDKELAMVLGTTVQSVNKWRHAHNLPDIDNLYALSRMFGILIDDLIVPAGYKEHKKTTNSQDTVSSENRIKIYFQMIKNIVRKSLTARTVSFHKIGCYGMDSLNLTVT